MLAGIKWLFPSRISFKTENWVYLLPFYELEYFTNFFLTRLFKVTTMNDPRPAFLRLFLLIG
jgi:hypothetical protein